MYKKFITLSIFAIIIVIVLIYIKNIVLYHPLPVVVEKYNRFYQKILQLVESNKFVTNLFVETADGISLDTVYVANPETTKCIIFFHGNTGNLAMRFDMIKFLYNYASVVIFDYRSFGRSGGDSNMLSARSLYKDADAIWEFVTKRCGYAPNNISLFGESLGCAVAIQLAARLSKTMDATVYPHSVILNAPFYSLSSMIVAAGSKLGAGFAGRLLAPIVGNEYKSNEAIKLINHKTKIVIAHSPRDELVPYSEGWRLYMEVADNCNAKFIGITGTHNNLGLTDAYVYGLADMFD